MRKHSLPIPCVIVGVSIVFSQHNVIYPTAVLIDAVYDFILLTIQLEKSVFRSVGVEVV